MDLTIFLTRATASMAFLCFAIALVLRFSANGSRMKASRLWWTAGCLVLIVHVLCAFQFVHHWSHRAAYDATARQTAALAGFDSGSGLFVNYVVVVVWLSDVLWWWRAPSSYSSRSRTLNWLVLGFLAFVWFNATVVFGRGVVQWLSAVAWLLLIVLWWPNRLPTQGTG